MLMLILLPTDTVSAVRLIPAEAPMLKDPRFLRDRADFAGVAREGPSPLSPEALAAARPEALAEVRDAAELLETTLLADGRDWVLGGTPGPALADIEAVWVLMWVARSKCLLCLLGSLIYRSSPRRPSTMIADKAASLLRRIQCLVRYPQMWWVRANSPRCSRGSSGSNAPSTRRRARQGWQK